LNRSTKVIPSLDKAHAAALLIPVSVVGDETLSWVVQPGSDVAYLPGLRRDARRYGRYQGKHKAWVMMADSGFDGQTVQDDDLVPPVRRGGNLLSPERKARADLVSQARLDGLFGQRWKTETVNSVIKRKFGDTIRSRKRSLQRRVSIIKGLVYNTHR
jgi:hypothetical protein